VNFVVKAYNFVIFFLKTKVYNFLNHKAYRERKGDDFIDLNPTMR